MMTPVLDFTLALLRKNPTAHLFLLLAVTCSAQAVSPSTSSSAGPAEKNVPAAVKSPNVLFIVIDDLNDWVGCLHGHPQAQTPNMDRLAARGTLFTNAHAQSPLCNPSRSSVLTGLRPGTTGIYGLAPGFRSVEAFCGCVSLPQYLGQHDYFTAVFGKVYHDGAIPPKFRKTEVDVWGPAPFAKLPPHKFVDTPDKMRGVDWGVYPPDDHDQPDWITADNAIAQLKSHPKDKPFFLGVGFRLPHVPLFVSQKWLDRFPPEDQITLPPHKDKDRDDVPPFAWYLNWKLPEPRLSWLKKEHQWRPLVRAYLASTTFMDSQLGRVLDALDASGEASNTIVVLWSDNGWHLGEKDITGKNSLWERSTHVPLIFAGPGVASGAKCDQPAELLDIYPTLVELCGLPPKSDLEGHSLAPQLKHANAARQWPAITSHNPGNDSIRTTQWRYIRYADGSQEIYDEQKDPNEWNNVVSNPENAPVIRELAKWLPKDRPLAPGSKFRTLEKVDGVWLWEGKPIKPEELEK